MVVDREAVDISALSLALGIHRDPVDVAESFCPGSLTKAPMFSMTPGTIYDLRGWSLADHKQQTRCRLELEELEPCFILGSPVAASLNLSPADGVAHLNYLMELYAWQHTRGRLFLNEHPWGAWAWSWRLGSMQKVVALKGVEVRRGDDELVLQPTGWMSNCIEVLDEVAKRCTNKDDNTYHQHGQVNLQGARWQIRKLFPETAEGDLAWSAETSPGDSALMSFGSRSNSRRTRVDNHTMAGHLTRGILRRDQDYPWIRMA